MQQKQIVVTCNYVARRRGIYKLQPVREAKKMCPDAIIVLGEDLSRFRDVSKDLYSFLTRFVWSNKSERLGFDEVFLDVSDMVSYNIEQLDYHNLPNSFFYLDKQDPTVGFKYDASNVTGNTFPESTVNANLLNGNSICLYPSARFKHTGINSASLETRLIIGSHLARYLRLQLEERKGYTASVGIR